MRRNFNFIALAVTLATASAFAQPTAPLDLEVVVTGAQVGAANDNVTTVANVEIDGVAVSADGVNVYFFESESGSDQILKWDGASVTVFATEAELAGGSASSGDLDVDAAGTLYASIYNGSFQKVWSIPSTGFGTAVSMVAAANSVNLSDIEVDAKNSRLIVTYNDVFGAAAEDVTSVPLNASDAVPTVIASEAALEVALATIPGYVDDTENDVDIFDVTVQSDGDIIIAHGFASAGTGGVLLPLNGSLLKVTETGTVSVFKTAQELIAATGVANPENISIGNVHVEALPGDKILVHVGFTSDNDTENVLLEPFIGVLDADGSNFNVLATESQLAGDADLTGDLNAPLFAFDGKDGDVAANGDYFFYRQGGAVDDNAILALTGVDAAANPLAVRNHWFAY